MNSRIDPEREWRESLKVGDEVILRTAVKEFLATITGASPQQVRIHDMRFWRSDGYQMGAVDGWATIHRPTPQSTFSGAVRSLEARLKLLPFSPKNMDRLRRIKEILDAPEVQ